MPLLIRNYHMEISKNCFRIRGQWHKGSVVGMSLMCTRKREEVSVAQMWWVRGTRMIFLKKYKVVQTNGRRLCRAW